MQAGLASPDDPDQLLIALEPEAASFYCRTLQMKDFLGETGDESVNEDLASYVVIDNGGQIFLLTRVMNQPFFMFWLNFAFHTITTMQLSFRESKITVSLKIPSKCLLSLILKPVQVRSL